MFRIIKNCVVHVFSKKPLDKFIKSLLPRSRILDGYYEVCCPKISLNFMSNSIRKILVLAANPISTERVRLEKEMREIEQGLKLSRQRDQFMVEQKWAVQPLDIHRALLEAKPQIVHFSGHGAGEAGLIFEDEQGKAQLVSTQALANLFNLFAETIECVVLNGCYSTPQAEAIAEQIPAVVGMSDAISDRASIAFAVGFYDALGAGESLTFAYKLGCNAIEVSGESGQFTPVLLTNSVQNDSSLPIAAIKMELPEGQVPLNSSYYIERPPLESDCYEAITQPGSLIRVKAPRQMGKSSLLSRILNYGQEIGFQTVIINFQSADTEFLSDTDQFMKWFCLSVATKLSLDKNLDSCWEGVLGVKQKSTKFFQNHLLTKIDTPLLLGLDDVDQIFKYKTVAENFFGLIRTWHEQSKNEDLWQKLKFVISHSQEVYPSLKFNHSPFNVGLPVELPEFDRDQVKDLVKRHSLNWSNLEIDKLMGVADGHPYLLREALYQIAKQRMTLDEYVMVAPKSDSLYKNHLHRHLVLLKENPYLLEAMRKVVNADVPISLDPTASFKLRSMGLIEFKGNEVVPLCNLYRDFFLNRLSE